MSDPPRSESSSATSSTWLGGDAFEWPGITPFSQRFSMNWTAVSSAVSHGYDSDGNRTRLSYPDGKMVTYTYDLAARLANVTDWQVKTTAYIYNALGQPLTAALPNSVASRFNYDNAGRLITMSHATAVQSLANYTYAVDAIGNRTQIVESTLISSTNPVTTYTTPLQAGL